MTACRGLVWLLLATAGLPAAPITRAESGSEAGRGVPFPSRDILNPETMPARATPLSSNLEESQRELRRPLEPAGGKPPSAESKAAAEDRRIVGRSGESEGFGRLGDFLPLIAVLGFVLLAAWAVKRFMPARRLITGAGVMEILARMPLSARQSLVLVKLGHRLVLVGVSPERVNTVCIVDDPDQVALLIGRVAQHARGSSAEAFDSSLDQEADVFDSDERLASRAGGPIRGLLEKVRSLKKHEVA